MEVVGRCHICRERREIRFCKMCQHWFCAACQHRWWDRGLAALKEFVGNPTPHCCGV